MNRSKFSRSKNEQITVQFFNDACTITAAFTTLIIGLIAVILGYCNIARRFVLHKQESELEG